MKTPLKIRRPREADVKRIQEIAAQNNSNPLPNKFETAAVVLNDSLIAFGVNRVHFEALFYLDNTVSKREKVNALKKIMEIGILDAKGSGIEEIHVFAETEQFAEILIKHFGFRRAKGVPLIRDL